MTGELFINGYDAYTTWGVSLNSSGLSALMTPPPMKDMVENKSRLQYGKRVVSSTMRTDERSISITFNLSASSEDEFFERYTAFCEVLTSGLLEITTKWQDGVVYRMYYQSCTQFTEYMRGVAQFALKLDEPNCNDRGTTAATDE